MAYTPPLPYTLHFRYATPAQFLHGLGEWDEWMNGKKWIYLISKEYNKINYEIIGGAPINKLKY